VWASSGWRPCDEVEDGLSDRWHAGLWRRPPDSFFPSRCLEAAGLEEGVGYLLEAQVLIEQWRVHYNTVRPHSSLGYRPPAPEVIVLGVARLPGNPGPTGSNQPPVAMLH